MIKKKCCEHGTNHPEHVSELPKLNRIIGQLEGIKKMIESNRYCPDILIQLMAARSAIRSVSGNILKRHLESCVSESFGNCCDQKEKIDEIKKLFDKFD